MTEEQHWIISTARSLCLVIFVSPCLSPTASGRRGFSAIVIKFQIQNSIKLVILFTILKKSLELYHPQTMNPEPYLMLLRMDSCIKLYIVLEKKNLGITRWKEMSKLYETFTV